MLENIAVAEDEMLIVALPFFSPLFFFTDVHADGSVLHVLLFCNPSVHICWRCPNFVLQLLLIGVLLSSYLFSGSGGTSTTPPSF